MTTRRGFLAGTVCAVSAIMLALILAIGHIAASTGPLVTSARQVGSTTVLTPTWRAWVAPPWMVDEAWEQSVSVAGSQMPRTQAVHDQYLCHWLFARPVWPLQRTWGLDADRPDVGLAQVITAACNPT